MQPIKIFNLKRAIIKIKQILDEDKIVVIDDKNTVRIFDLKELKLDGGFKINLPDSRIFANNVDVSKDGSKFAMTIPNKNKVAVWDIPHKKMMYNLGWHKGEIESVAFDPKLRYVTTGGTDGRTHLWNIHTGKMVGSLAPHADYVTAIAFSNNGVWCATGSYDRTVSITNISSMQHLYKLRLHSTKINKIKFLSNFHMVSGDKDGNLVLSDYTKGKVIKRLHKMQDEVVDFVFNQDEHYMFAATKDVKIFLYDLHSGDVISNDLMKTSSSVSALEFVADLNYLIVGTVDGILYVYDLLADEATLKEYIKEENYVDAYALVEKNPLLKKSQTYQHLEELWEEAINKAQRLLEAGKKSEADMAVKPFMAVPSKRLLLQALFKDFAEFEKFKMLVKKKKYAAAYSIANKHPSFKETSYYKLMEEEWEKAFNLARQLIFKPNQEEVVQKLLFPFKGIPEKTPLIQALVNEKEIYQVLKHKLASRDFEGFFRLIDRYPFLASLDEYQKAMEFGHKLLDAAREALRSGNYKKVLQYTELLQHFPDLKEEAKELQEKSNTLANFMSLIASKAYNQVYEYVKKEPWLEETEDFQKIERMWEERVAQAEKASAQGDVRYILETLENYMKIKEKLPKIGELVKTAYLYQILSKIKEKADIKLLERGIKNYLKIFGLDEEIKDLIDTIKKQYKKEIDISHMEEGNKFIWYKMHVPYDIFEEMDED
ncbi:MAG: hypothetical protein GXO40_01685 [Epsilonproteobacteria bacterium]|nr:hypothetical protein [Campylobacterota bacterium]